MASKPSQEASRPLKRLRMDVEAEATEREVDTAEALGTSSASVPPPITEALLPFVRLLGQDLVKITVGGSPARVYYAHKKLLSKHSAFFDAALNSGFKEGTENEIVLEEEDSLTFEVLLNWLYTSSLPTLAEYFEVPVKYQASLAKLILRVYIMSDRFIIPRLKNVAYKAILEVFKDRTIPDPGFIDELHEFTSPDDQLRLYFVEMCKHDLHNSASALLWMRVIKDNERFATDVLIAKHNDSSQNHVPADPYHLEQYHALRDEKDLRAVLREPPMQKQDTSSPPGKQHELITTIFHNMIVMLHSSGSLPNSQRPHAQPSISAMRAAGFFHRPWKTRKDLVECVNCQKQLSGWIASDKPFKKHQEVSPECPFVEAVELGLEPPLLPYFCMPLPPKNEE